MKIANVILVAFFLTPSFAKISHAFADHEHLVCTSNKIAHVHQMDVECEFYKFKVSKEFTYPTYTTTSLIQVENQAPINVGYEFISDYRKLHFNLRGPPTIV